MSQPSSRNWIVVASADHVRTGRAGGFMQAGHGKEAPLRRVRPGDRVACYSPTSEFGGKDRLQAFTEIGIARDGEPDQFDMGGGFVRSGGTLPGCRRTQHRFNRCSTGWSSRPVSVTGATSSASDCSRSATTI